MLFHNKTHSPSQFCKMLQRCCLRVTRNQLLLHFLQVSLTLCTHQEIHQSRVTHWQLHIRHRFHLPRYCCSLAGCGLMNRTRTHVSCCWHICHTLGHTFICAALRVLELLIKTFIIIFLVSSKVLWLTKTWNIYENHIFQLKVRTCMLFK